MISSSELVTVVIPNWNGKEWLEKCLAGLAGQNFTEFSVIIVDNGSIDSSVDFILTHYPAVNIIRLDKNFGFARAVNTGIQSSRSRYVILMNNDTIPAADWISELVRMMDSSGENIGFIASKMLQLDSPGLIDSAGDALDWSGSALKRGHDQPAEKFDCPEPVFSACAGAALYRREFLDQTRGFDERFGSYLEDIDICLRGHVLGFTGVYAPKACIYHKGHGSSIRQSRYIFLMTRNRLMLFFKNMPFRLLIRHSIDLVLGQVYFVLTYRSLSSLVSGYCSFIMQIPYIMRCRRLLRKRVITDIELEKLLSGNGTFPDSPLLSGLSERFHTGKGLL